MIPFYHERMPNASGIYRITCTTTGKIYIGSATNLRKRRNEHFRHLRRGIHDNPKLQNAWNKYSPDAFTFEVLELVLPMSLTAREQYWFKKLKPFGKNGFNILKTAGSTLGQKASKETRQKMSKSQQGRRHSAETREKMRLSRLGHSVSAATRAKQSAIKQGRKPDPKIYDARRKTLIVTSPDGTECIVTGIRRFCREHNLSHSLLLHTVQGRYRGRAFTQHKGYKARLPESDVS